MEILQHQITTKIAQFPVPDPKQYVPLEITFNLGSPVMITYPWLMLDGILAVVIAESVLGSVFNELPRRVPIDFVDALPIPLLKESFDNDFYYHASVSRFQLPSTGSRRFIKHPAFEFAKYIEHPQKKYRINGGEFKPCDKTLICNYSPWVKFWAMGDELLIRDYCNQLIGLGKKVGSGNGRILKVEVKRIEQDFSLYHPEFGRNRPIPSKDTTLPRAYLTHKPPYWKETHTLCAVPDGF